MDGTLLCNAYLFGIFSLFYIIPEELIPDLLAIFQAIGTHLKNYFCLLAYVWVRATFLDIDMI